LSASERAELAATAHGLPHSWVVVYNEYTRQVSLAPREYLRPLAAYTWWDPRSSVAHLRRFTGFRHAR
jgi:hypothetical protein